MKKSGFPYMKGEVDDILLPGKQILPVPIGKEPLIGGNESSELDQINVFHYNDYLRSDNHSKNPTRLAGD